MEMDLWTAASPNGWKVSIMLEELKEAGIELPEVEVKNLSPVSYTHLTLPTTTIV